MKFYVGRLHRARIPKLFASNAVHAGELSVTARNVYVGHVEAGGGSCQGETQFRRRRNH